MKQNQTLIEDLLKVAESALGNIVGVRKEFGAHLREKSETIAHRLDLVSRSEFDSAMAMISKARAMQEDLNERLRAIETKLNLSSAGNKKKKASRRLPTVKHAKSRAKRK